MIASEVHSKAIAAGKRAGTEADARAITSMVPEAAATAAHQAVLDDTWKSRLPAEVKVFADSIKALVEAARDTGTDLYASTTATPTTWATGV
eukprot:5714578-Amphidinium_carterae.1